MKRIGVKDDEENFVKALADVVLPRPYCTLGKVVMPV